MHAALQLRISSIRWFLPLLQAEGLQPAVHRIASCCASHCTSRCILLCIPLHPSVHRREEPGHAALQEGLLLACSDPHLLTPLLCQGRTGARFWWSTQAALCMALGSQTSAGLNGNRVFLLSSHRNRREQQQGLQD